MMVNENNNVPRILRIRKDGTIVVLVQNDKLNENLNEKTVTREQEYREYGKPLYEDYINQKLSRYERNKGDYDNDDANQEQDNIRPDDYYTDRDKQRDWEQKQGLDKSKKKNKWLWGVSWTCSYRYYHSYC